MSRDSDLGPRKWRLMGRLLTALFTTAVLAGLWAGMDFGFSLLWEVDAPIWGWPLEALGFGAVCCWAGLEED